MDVGIIDDPVKDQQDASSERIRMRIWEWYTDVFLTRTHNDSKILLTMTRWHEDDLAGRILEKEADKWEVVRFPAVKENNDDSDDPRNIGAALWPERHSLESLMDKKRNSERTFNSLYQQRPAALEGNIFKREHFTIVQMNWEPYRDVMRFYIDAAYTEKEKNDPSCIATYFVHNRKVYIVEMENVRLTFEDLKSHVNRKVKKYGNERSSKVKIEGKGPGLSLVQSFKKDPKYKHLRVKDDKVPHYDKESRAHSTVGFIERGDFILIDGPYVSEYIEQHCAFPNAKHDDMVDCSTAIIRIELLKSGKGHMGKS